MHNTNRATPKQLVFGRDAILNIHHEANWNFIKEQKQKLSNLNNTNKNKKRKTHNYNKKIWF